MHKCINTLVRFYYPQGKDFKMQGSEVSSGVRERRTEGRHPTLSKTVAEGERKEKSLIITQDVCVHQRN